MQFEQTYRVLKECAEWWRDRVGKCEIEFSSDEYHAKTRWFQPGSDSEVPLSKHNGVYAYTSVEGKIWYVGKGCRSGGGGIGQQSCSHLGKAIGDHTDGAQFPFHQWANDDSVEPRVRDALTAGDFFIRTVKIDPDLLSSFFEVLIQTVHEQTIGSLPPLNKRIG